MNKAKQQPQHNRWARDTVKEAYWRTQIAAWQKSGLSIRAYCREHGVIETSFYAWRRELLVRSRENDKGADKFDGAGIGTVRDARGRNIPLRLRESLDDNMVPPASSSNPFIPLSVVTEGRQLQEPSSGLKIVTPSGYQIFVTNANDFNLLDKALHLLEKKS